MAVLIRLAVDSIVIHGLEPGPAFFFGNLKKLGKPGIQSGVTICARQIWIGFPVTAIAASFSASLCVGWALQV